MNCNFHGYCVMLLSLPPSTLQYLSHFLHRRQHFAFGTSTQGSFYRAHVHAPYFRVMAYLMSDSQSCRGYCYYYCLQKRLVTLKNYHNMASYSGKEKNLLDRDIGKVPVSSTRCRRHRHFFSGASIGSVDR